MGLRSSHVVKCSSYGLDQPFVYYTIDIFSIGIVDDRLTKNNCGKKELAMKIPQAFLTWLLL